jgi:hypothetical protein
VLQGPDRYLGAVADPDLAQDRLHVDLDGCLSDIAPATITLLACPLTIPSRIWISRKVGKCVLANKTPRRGSSDGDRFEASENLAAELEPTPRKAIQKR